MSFYLAWLVTGVVIGWAFKTLIPGERPLLPAVISGVVGAFVGGLLANAFGKAAVLGPSVMGAMLGATLFSGAVIAYQMRQNKA